MTTRRPPLKPSHSPPCSPLEPTSTGRWRHYHGGLDLGPLRVSRKCHSRNLRTSIFHATGAVFVFMQVLGFARWAWTGSIIYHPGSSLKPQSLPGPPWAASAVVSSLAPSARWATVLSQTLGDSGMPRGQVTTLGDPQMKDFNDEMESSLSLQYCKAGITSPVCR